MKTYKIIGKTHLESKYNDIYGQFHEKLRNTQEKYTVIRYEDDVTLQIMGFYKRKSDAIAKCNEIPQPCYVFLNSNNEIAYHHD